MLYGSTTWLFFFLSGPRGAVLSYKKQTQPQGGPNAKGSRGWVRGALTISVFHPLVAFGI